MSIRLAAGALCALVLGSARAADKPPVVPDFVIGGHLTQFG